MQIETPSAVPLPPDVQKAIEAARNTVSMMNAEHSRLSKLVKNLDGDVKSKHVEKTNLESQIQVLSDAHAELQSKHDALLSEHSQEKDNLESTKKEIDSLKKQIEEILVEHGKRKEKLDLFSADLNEKASALSSKESELQTWEKELTDKRNLLKKLAQDLNG